MDPILEFLEQDGKATPEHIAKMLKMIPAEVSKKIEEYEKEEVIVGYKAIVNHEKSEKDYVCAAIEIKVTIDQNSGFDLVAQRISKFSEVKYCALMSGQYDLMIIVECAGMKQLAHFVSEKLSTVGNILSTSTHFVLKPFKQNGILLTSEKGHERLKVAP